MDNTMTYFTGLSAVLTGFNESVIAPTLDPVDIKSAYLQEWTTRVASESQQNDLTATILKTFEALKSSGKSDQEIGEALLNGQQSEEFVMACRKLIYLWYMGGWPTVESDPSSDTGGTTFSSPLSGDAYTSGLVWKVMQAHPMGDSNYRYGYWAEKPADLSAYTGNSDA